MLFSKQKRFSFARMACLGIGIGICGLVKTSSVHSLWFIPSTNDELKVLLLRLDCVKNLIRESRISTHFLWQILLALRLRCGLRNWTLLCILFSWDETNFPFGRLIVLSVTECTKILWRNDSVWVGSMCLKKSFFFHISSGFVLWVYCGNLVDLSWFLFRDFFRSGY